MLKPALERVLVRCCRPIFSNTEDVREAMAALLDLSAYANRAVTKLIAKPLRRFCHKDPDTIATLLETVPIDAAEFSHGRRAAMLLRCIPNQSCDEVIWERVVRITLMGLQGHKWSLHDCSVAIAHAGRGGRHAPALAAAAEELVAAKVRTASQSELPVLLVILTSLPDLSRSPCIQGAADRIVQLAEILSPAAIGQICACVNKISLRHTAMAIALQEEAIRFAEESDLFSAVQLFSFVCQQEKDAISPDAVKCLVERVIEGRDLDQTTVMALCRALRAIPRTLRPELLREITEMMEFLGVEAKGLLLLPVVEGGLKGDVPVEDVQLFISRFLALDCLLPEEHTRPDAYIAAVESCVECITERLEDIVSDENPPFSIIPHLLDINMEAARQCGLAIIREAAEQGIHFPTLQAFRFLLALGDHNMKDKRVYRHLRNEFAKTAAGIPMIQLCAALKCFVRGLVEEGETQSLDEQVEQELEREDMDAFLRFCVENLLRGFADGMEVKCV
ncbi:unnamed protein product, partial [Trypanosoma congolense IL3000]